MKVALLNRQVARNSRPLKSAKGKTTRSQSASPSPASLRILSNSVQNASKSAPDCLFGSLECIRHTGCSSVVSGPIWSLRPHIFFPVQTGQTASPLLPFAAFSTVAISRSSAIMRKYSKVYKRHFHTYQSFIEHGIMAPLLWGESMRGPSSLPYLDSLVRVTKKETSSDLFACRGRLPHTQLQENAIAI